MVLLVKHKFATYRRYEKDIWGVTFNDPRAGKVTRITNKNLLVIRVKSPYLKYFYIRWSMQKAIRWSKKQRYVYRLDVLPPDRRRRKFNLRFVTVRLTRLYFMTMQNYQFRSMFKRASKLDGELERNYTYLLEGRCLCIYYRTLFTASLFESLRFIKLGYLIVNNKKIYSYNALVPIGKFFHPITYLKNRIKGYLWSRVRAKSVLFNVPFFMFITFFFMKILLLHYPLKKNFVYPIELDVARMTGYY